MLAVMWGQSFRNAVVAMCGSCGTIHDFLSFPSETLMRTFLMLTVPSCCVSLLFVQVPSCLHPPLCKKKRCVENKTVPLESQIVITFSLKAYEAVHRWSGDAGRLTPACPIRHSLDMLSTTARASLPRLPVHRNSVRSGSHSQPCRHLSWKYWSMSEQWIAYNLHHFLLLSFGVNAYFPVLRVSGLFNVC